LDAVAQLKPRALFKNTSLALECAVERGSQSNIPTIYRPILIRCSKAKVTTCAVSTSIHRSTVLSPGRWRLTAYSGQHCMTYFANPVVVDSTLTFPFMAFAKASSSFRRRALYSRRRCDNRYLAGDTRLHRVSLTSRVRASWYSLWCWSSHVDHFVKQLHRGAA
jgi:hypothetical protein